MAERLKPILTMGKEAGLLIFDDIDEAFRTFLDWWFGTCKSGCCLATG
ncbi:hypothetical protein M798_13195 [Brucella melitensis ADMAS-G1]|nr:hypothetical protein M798_13195 [Brucella melitensis ADMAS-G1]